MVLDPLIAFCKIYSRKSTRFDILRRQNRIVALIYFQFPARKFLRVDVSVIISGPVSLKCWSRLKAGRALISRLITL